MLRFEKPCYWGYIIQSVVAKFPDYWYLSDDTADQIF